MDIGTLSLFGVLLALVILIVFSYKGMSILITAPVATMMVLALSGMDIIQGMSKIYAASLGDFVIKNYLILVSASIFGSILGECGAAQDIAYTMTSKLDTLKRGNKKFIALMLLMAVFAILVYGGVSGFVIVFTMVPLCKRIFKQYDIPWHLYMAVHSAGGNLFAATMLPGSPSVQNLIPVEMLGTDPMAAPIMGTVVALFAIICSVIYIRWVLMRSDAKGEGFMETGSGINETILAEDSTADGERENGSFWKALFPIIFVLVTMNVFDVDPAAALLGGTLVTLVLYIKKLKNLNKSLGNGAMDGAKTLLIVAAVVGFGGVVAATPGYELIIGGLSSIPGSPLIQLVIAINVVAGITGSASAGESIALETFGKDFLAMGYPPNVIHRISAIACQGLDSLPHGSSIINQLQVARLTHKQGYGHVFVLACVVPFVGGFVAVACYYLGLI